MTGRNLDGASDSLGDDAVAELIMAGDERGLMAAYDRHGSTLYAIAVRFLGDREAAAEVVQETFLALWQRADRFDPQAGSLLGWLIGITRFRSLDRIRAERRRPPLVNADRSTRDRWNEPSPGSGPLPSRTPAAVQAGDPAVEADRRWMRAVVRGALSEMGERDREILVLAYDDGLSQSEISARLELPLGTVKSRTRRAMATLRERLRDIPGLVDQ